jgi:hypothetical protein
MRIEPADIFDSNVVSLPVTELSAGPAFRRLEIADSAARACL